MLLPDAFARYALPVALIGLTSVLYGALVALAQTDLKRLVAYTSVNHMGYVVIGVAAAPDGRPWLRDGALCFIEARAKTRELGRLGGLMRPMPLYGSAAALAFFASLNLPGLAQFRRSRRSSSGPSTSSPRLPPSQRSASLLRLRCCCSRCSGRSSARRPCTGGVAGTDRSARADRDRGGRACPGAAAPPTGARWCPGRRRARHGCGLVAAVWQDRGFRTVLEGMLVVDALSLVYIGILGVAGAVTIAVARPSIAGRGRA